MAKIILLTIATLGVLFAIFLLPRILNWRAERYSQYAEALDRLDLHVRRLLDRGENEPHLVKVANALVFLSGDRHTARKMLSRVGQSPASGGAGLMQGRLGQLLASDVELREDYRQALLACFDAVTANSPIWGSVLRVQTASTKSETIVREAAKDYSPLGTNGLAGAHC
jgi:hypothetical protein